MRGVRTYKVVVWCVRARKEKRLFFGVKETMCVNGFFFWYVKRSDH